MSVERPPAGQSALRDDDAVRAALRNDELAVTLCDLFFSVRMQFSLTRIPGKSNCEFPE